jgi:hypothetical protein
MASVWDVVTGKGNIKSNRQSMGPVYDSGVNRAMDQRVNRLGAPISTQDVDSLLNGSLGNSGVSGGGGGRGVTRGLFANAQVRGTGQPGEPAQETRPGLFDMVRQQYGDLESQLMELSRQYATGINESTGSTARMLQGVDPTAAYRVTAPSFAAPPAAATSYLEAIGANPSQVQAQQAYMNQMMQSQAGSQSDYQRAVDQANTSYREAQIAELYRNAAEAQAGLGAATQGQRAQLGMQRLKDEQGIRNALLEYQLAILQAQAQKGGGRGGGPLPFPNLGSISF